MATSTPQNKDDSMAAFLKTMGSVLGPNRADDSKNTTDANGPAPKIKKDPTQAAMAKDLKRLADSFEDFTKKQDKRDTKLDDVESNKERKDQDWQKSMLDALESNTANGKNGRDGKGGGGGLLGSILSGLGGLAASILGPTGILKAFKTLGHVVGAVYKGGKVFASVLTKTGKVLVSFTAAVGKMAGKLAKMAGKAISKTVGGAVNLGKRLLGFGGRGATRGASEGSFLRRAGNFFRSPSSMMEASGGASRLSRIGGVIKGAGGGIARTIVGRTAGKAIPILGTALAGADLIAQTKKEWQQKEDTKGAGWGGIANGAMSGGTIGATIGSVIPGVGTAIGGAIGGIAGGGMSAILQHKKAIEKYFSHTWESVQGTFKTISNFTEHLWNGSKAAWDKIILPRLKSMGETLEKAWKASQPALHKVASVIETIGSVVETVMTKVFSGIGTVVSGIMKHVGPGLKWLAKQFGISTEELDAVASAFSSPISSASASDTVNSGNVQLTSNQAPAPTQPGVVGSDGSTSNTDTPSQQNQNTANQFEQQTTGTITNNQAPSSQPLNLSTSDANGSANTSNGFSGPLDEDKYMAVLAQAESNGKANAKNPTSSATGLWQITTATLQDINKKNGTHWTMRDLKDPRISYQAEKTLLSIERGRLGEDGNDPERLAAAHVLGVGGYNRRVRGHANWKAELQAAADRGDNHARDAIRDVGIVGRGYATANGSAIAALGNGGSVPASSTFAQSASGTASSGGTSIATHVSGLRSAIEQQTAMMKQQHAQTMKAAAQGQSQQADNRSFDWEKIHTSAVPQDISILLAKRT